MIELKNHVGELNWSLFPFYALTNWVAAFRAYQLYEMNIIIRLWMVTGLIGGASGHFMDLYQVLKVCTYIVQLGVSPSLVSRYCEGYSFL